MSSTTGPSSEDLEKLQAFASALADGVSSAIGPWVVRSVIGTCERSGVMVTGVLRQQATAAGVTAANEVAPQVRALLELDISDQRIGPLEIVRRAVRFPTEILRSAGVAPVRRDESAKAMFPEDAYDLTPGSFGDLDPDLQEAGLVWGAAKAHVFLARRRALDHG
ncbi:MAG: hypothetical protein WEA11_09105 [Acidimicrobiales bacterium]